MDRFREPVAAIAHNLKPARRRLQKGDKTRSVSFKRSSQDSNASSIESGLRSVTRQVGFVGPAAVPLPPDLSDAKWLEYLEQHGLEPSPVHAQYEDQLPATPPATPIIPEFSHLAVSGATRRPSRDASHASASANRHSTISVMRRQAKTPVFKVGQLEKSASRRRDAETAAAAKNTAEEAFVEKPCSVELIAEQYRALLESRDEADAESIYTTAEETITPPPGRFRPFYDNSPNSDIPRACATLGMPTLSNQSALSPTSDDGTLVAFEEDAIYFKPVSFSPEPSPPPHRQSFETAASVSSRTQENLGLQICMGMLTRELTSTLADRRSQASRDNSSLQIWVMIEAYERLRDQVSSVGLEAAELQTLRAVFDSWLAVLYKVHRSMADAAAASESDYEGLEEDLD